MENTFCGPRSDQNPEPDKWRKVGIELDRHHSDAQCHQNLRLRIRLASIVEKNCGGAEQKSTSTLNGCVGTHMRVWTHVRTNMCECVHKLSCGLELTFPPPKSWLIRRPKKTDVLNILGFLSFIIGKNNGLIMGPVHSSSVTQLPYDRINLLPMSEHDQKIHARNPDWIHENHNDCVDRPSLIHIQLTITHCSYTACREVFDQIAQRLQSRLGNDNVVEVVENSRAYDRIYEKRVEK